MRIYQVHTVIITDWKRPFSFRHVTARKAQVSLITLTMAAYHLVLPVAGLLHAGLLPWLTGILKWKRANVNVIRTATPVLLWVQQAKMSAVKNTY